MTASEQAVREHVYPVSAIAVIRVKKLSDPNNNQRLSTAESDGTQLFAELTDAVT
jgi:hypothetical protein